MSRLTVFTSSQERNYLGIITDSVQCSAAYAKLLQINLLIYLKKPFQGLSGFSSKQPCRYRRVRRERAKEVAIRNPKEQTSTLQRQVGAIGAISTRYLQL